MKSGVLTDTTCSVLDGERGLSLVDGSVEDHCLLQHLCKGEICISLSNEKRSRWLMKRPLNLLILC